MRRAMTARGRQGVLFVVLALVVVIKAAQPGPLFGNGSRPQPFPGRVVVPAAPTYDLNGDHPDIRVLQLVTSMNAMWQAAFRSAGDDYRIPRVATRDQES